MYSFDRGERRRRGLPETEPPRDEAAFGRESAGIRLRAR